MNSKFFIIIICLLFTATDLFAQSENVSFEVSSDKRLKSAYVLILTDSTSTHSLPQVYQREALVKELGGDKYLLSFDLDSSFRKESVKVQVNAFSDEGRIVVWPVMMLMSIVSESSLISDSYFQTKDAACRTLGDLGIIEELYQMDKERLSKVIAIKRQKNKLLKAKLEKILTPEVLTLLNKYEKALNINRTREISSSMPLDELVARITALNSFSKTKQK